MFKTLTCAVASALLTMSAFAAPGTMIKEDALRAAANASSGVVGRVAKGANVEVLQRQAGWTQVKHEGKTGWVRILSVRTASAGGGNVLGGILQMGTAQREPSKVVAVAGLRGLNDDELPGSGHLGEDQLRRARFNAQELTQLERYISSRGDAQSYAQTVGLNSLVLSYLPAAKRETETGGGGSIWGEGSL